MSRFFKAAVPLAFLLACSSGGTSLPEITSFTATPTSIHAGESALLEWTVTNASQISIDNGVGVQQGHSVSVSPTVTTTYKLTATGLSGDTTATVTVTVLSAIAKPVITSFSADSTDVPTGSSATLSWAVTGTVTSLTLSDGTHAPIDVTGTASKSVTPDAPTTYTLTATNAGGSDSKSVTISVHSPSLRLSYTDPTSTTAKILVVKNASSTNSRLVLDVKVGANPVTAFGFAMNVPLERTIPADNATSGPIALDASLSPAGLISNSSVINIGSSPSTGAVMLGGAAMPTVLSVGVAKHKATLSDGDDTWPAGATLFSIAIKMVGSPATGNVFIGSTVATNPSFRASALRKDGSEAVGKADIALGNFTISL